MIKSQKMNNDLMELSRRDAFRFCSKNSLDDEEQILFINQKFTY